jgi:hypothetical protein
VVETPTGRGANADSTRSGPGSSPGPPAERSTRSLPDAEGWFRLGKYRVGLPYDGGIVLNTPQAVATPAPLMLCVPIRPGI